MYVTEDKNSWYITGKQLYIFFILQNTFNELLAGKPCANISFPTLLVSKLYWSLCYYMYLGIDTSKMCFLSFALSYGIYSGCCLFSLHIILSITCVAFIEVIIRHTFHFMNAWHWNVQIHSIHLKFWQMFYLYFTHRGKYSQVINILLVF